MPSKKQKSRKKLRPPTHVVTLYNYDPSQSGGTFEDDLGIATPNISSQLSYRRGDQLAVVSETIDWWILCQKMTGGQRGYVYTGYLAPLCRASPERNSNDSESDDGEATLIPCLSEKYIDMKYFPNAPKATYLSQQREICPEEKANFFSVITFWWMTSLIWKGFKKPLEDADLWKLGKTKSAAFIVEQFSGPLKQQLEHMKKKSTAVTEVGHVEEKETLVPNGKEKKTDEDLKKEKIEFNVPYLPLVKALSKAFGLTFLIGSIFKLFQDILLFVSPQILKYFIRYAAGEGPQEWWRGYMYAGLLFVVALIQSMLLHQYFHRAFITGLRIRTALIGTVYEKMLSLSNSARKEFTAGEMVNLMAVDATKLQDITTYFNMIWSAPFQIIASLYFLYQTMGVSVFAGLGVMIFLIPVNLIVSKRMKKLQTVQMKHKDARSKIMNEVLNGMRVLKLYAWESSFQEKIEDIRKLELKKLRSGAYLNALFAFSWRCAPYMVSLATFVCYVLLGNTLTAERAFVSLSLFDILEFPMKRLPVLVTQILQVSVATFATFVLTGNDLTAEKAFVAISLFNILQFPMNMLPSLVISIIQCQVSLRRMAKFLAASELDGSNVKHIPFDDDPDSAAVEIRNGCFTWDDRISPTLSNIELTAKKNSLTAIVGRVGCGKSSLLSAMLGELDKLSGEVTIQGSVAYVSQQAWIQNATLQENVLFGKPMMKRKYDRIIDACALRADLEVLPAGDLTEIGEKGINISGGQKQRISLARAVYANADVYLLDDPLSAVDAHVGKHIFDHLIGANGLLRQKAIIFVTHRVNILPEVDHIIVVDDGKISESGSYLELLNNGKSFADFLKTYLDEEEDEEQNSDNDDNARNSEDSHEKLVQRFERTISQFSADHDKMQLDDGSNRHSKDLGKATSTITMLSDLHHYYSSTSLHNDAVMADLLCAHEKEIRTNDPAGEMIKVETSLTGRVRLGVFTKYIKAVGSIIFFIGLILTASGEALVVSSRLWLASWSSDQNVSVSERDNYLLVYGLIGLGQAVAVLLANLTMSFGAYRASKNLHNSLLLNILHCGMSFFETTPIGRIINRFTKDINVIDETIPLSFKHFIGTACGVISTVFVISYATTYFLTVLLPLAVIYASTQRFYVKSSRQLKRLESVTRSPIFNHFLESINGASTIRAYKQEQIFTIGSRDRVDENQVAYYPSIAANRWLAVRLEFVGNLIVLFAALFAAVQKDNISPGLAGLAITSALQVTQTLNWMVRMTSELETNIVAVERVKEYAEVETEANWIIEKKRPPKDWPSKGAISFNEYSSRYRQGLDLVLKSLACEVQSCQKVGIVGRTGAGKSSIALSLFRIIEGAEGSIEIDNIPIDSIGLHDLRSKLSIIPQDPVLFCGSLRFNLDPFNKHSDAEIWHALEVAHLKPFASNLAEKLDYEISEGGENLSVGQRQLVCLGRALLRNSKVLVLDEATAAVDLETDDLIQETVRKEFKDCTILTIAHRLNTILDYDKIMVLDRGVIMEYDSPESLLNDPTSLFYGMAADAGIVKKNDIH